MTRREFLDAALFPLGRLTGDEREAVRQELDEHIEDRMEALLEMGWAEELAEERCVEAMGDPAEIGREMAKQYRGRGWVWLGRAAAVLTAVLCVQALLGLGMLGSAWDSMKARICRDTDIRSNLAVVEVSALPDIRKTIGNDVLRVVRISVGLREDGQRAAEVAACMYDRTSFGTVADGLLGKSELKNQRGETGTSGGGSGSYGVEQVQRWTPVQPGDTHVVLEYRAIGGVVEITIPLPEEGEA